MVQLRQLKVKTLYSSIIHPFGYLKWHGFHGNPLYDFKDWECSFKNIHISAVSHHRILNLVLNYFADKARLQDCRICKLSHLNIHECYEGCSNMNASSFISFFTYMLQENGKRFYKGLYVIFELAPDIKKNTVYLSSYSPLNEGHVSILTNSCFKHIPVI